jgi:hypothetical protein
MNKISKKIYQFRLVLRNIDEKTPNLEDFLYKAGCDDALINFRNGTVYLDFDREAFSFEQAVIQAIRDIESSPINAIVASVEPETLVTESDIAKRLNVKRQAVSLWIKGIRRKKKPFPKPIMKLSECSPLWKWSEICCWLYQNNIIDDESKVEEAVFLENLNVTLEGRYEEDRKIRQHLLKKIGSLKNPQKISYSIHANHRNLSSKRVAR